MFKSDFSILNDDKIVYLDSAASTQKPNVVLQKMDSFYRTEYANVHRGNCDLAGRATTEYEMARQIVAQFIHAHPNEIVFTKGTTESINLVASSMACILKPGDEILVSIAEHHANFVPWQQICLRTGATFKVFNVLPSGEIDWNDFSAKLSQKTKIVSVTQLSNVLGILNPIPKIVEQAHQVGALVFVDGAQSIAHTMVDVQKMGCDFFSFSGHKLYGPTGIGVLYGRHEMLNELSPYQFGGDMIRSVSIDETKFEEAPAKFEAGTPPFVEAIGLGAAVQYIREISVEKIKKHEDILMQRLLAQLKGIPDISFLGDLDPKLGKIGVVSFNIKSIHPADIAFVLSKCNVCIRIGHHCAMPIHHYFHQERSLRVSFGLYNEIGDVDFFVESLQKALRLLKGC